MSSDVGLGSSPSRRREVRRTLLIILVLNLAVAVAKLVVGWMSGSISMVADGFHSLTDSSSNVVGLVAVAIAARPPDEDHPYGHWKLETLAALFIGGLLAVTAAEVLRSCVERLRSGGVPEASPLTFVVMIVTMAVNFLVWSYERRQARRLHSEVLAADAAHTRSDLLTSASVLASLVAVRLGYPQVDLVVSLIITLVIARVAVHILWRAAGRLADPAAVPASEVRRVALTVPGVLGVHKIRSRRGPSGGFADLHVQVDAELRLDQAHVVGHLVADRLCDELGLEDVVAHVEPPVGHRTDWTPPSQSDGDQATRLTSRPGT